MILIDKMKNLKIYRTNTFLPRTETNKKKGSMVLMLAPNYQSSLKLMKHNMFINRKSYESYYLDRGITFLTTGQVGKEVEEEETVNEAVELEEFNRYNEESINEMSAEERNSLPDSAFGIPSKRKYPLDTEAHVKSAIRFFNYVSAEDEETLARNIIKAIKKFKMTPNVGKNNRFRKYYTPVNEFTHYKDETKYVNETGITESDLRAEKTGLDLSDKIMFFGEETDLLLESSASDSMLRRILFKKRMRTRKQIILHYDQVKKDLPWVKYTYPEIAKYRGRNMFVDLSYYMNIFCQSNTWTMMKGFNLFYDFMNRLLNNPVYNSNGYTKKTIFIPVLDWDTNHDGTMWNYRRSLNPVSIIYQLMYSGSNDKLLSVFKNTDIIFVGNTNYFKINFESMKAENMDLKKFSVKFKMFIMKISSGEQFDVEDIDTEAENVDSKDVIRNNIIDKIEDAKGVDLTAELHNAKIAKQSFNKNLKSIKYNKNGDTNKSSFNNYVKKSIEDSDKEVKSDDKILDTDKKTLLKSTLNGDPKSSNKMDKNAERKKAISDKLTDAIDSEYNHTEEDVYDSMNSDDDLKRMIMDLQSDSDDTDNGPDISAGRSSRMTKLDEELMRKEVKGKTIEEILNSSNLNEDFKPLKVDVASPNKEEWSNMKYAQFDKNYNIDKDIIACFKHFTTTSVPIAIRDISVENTSNSEDRIETYTVAMEDFRGKRFTIKLDIPIMVDNRFLLRGNVQSIQNQFFNMPILKTDTSAAQIISNYNKIFVYNRPRGSNKIQTGRSLAIVSRFLKAASKYTGNKIKFNSGNAMKISNKYDLPIDYIDIGSVYNTIESESIIIYFNQDDIRSKYTVDLSRGVPFAVIKKNYAGYTKDQIIYLENSEHCTFIQTLIWTVESAPEWKDFINLMYQQTASKSITYSRCSIMSEMIPLVLICCLHEGLTNTLCKAKIEYKLSERLTKEDRDNINNDWIRFSDGYLIFNGNDYETSLLLNGLKVCDTESHSFTEVDSRNMYLEFLDKFGGRIKADGLDNFKDLLIDPITKEILQKYNMPTDYVSVLLYANSLMCDNKFIKHTDASSRRIRRYEVIAAYTYKVLADAYAIYANEIKHLRNAATMVVKQSAVIDKFLTDSITSDSSCINALNEVEATNSITFKGPSGMNSDRAYSLDKRGYDDSMLNVLGMSTNHAGNTGVTRQTTIDANISPDRGFVKASDGNTDGMNTAKSLTMTEALTPFGSTHDSPMRTAMTFVQTSKHMVRTEDSDPLLVTSGADEVLPYLTTNKFAYKAKHDGIVEAYEPDKYILVKYKDGTKDYINLEETIEKNSDGGYFVPLKLDADSSIKVGMKFKENTILAYDKLSFSNDIGESNNLAYNIGKLAKVAIINSDENFEDSSVITESMAEKLATRIDLKYDVVLDKEINIVKYLKVGDHVECGDPLITWQVSFKDEDADMLMRSLSKDEVSDLGKKKLISEVTGTVKGIKIFRTIDPEDMTESMRSMVNEYEKPLKQKAKIYKENNLDFSEIPAHYKLPATGKLKRAQDAILIEYYVEYLDTVGIGDKIVYFSANKGVEKSMIPKGKEPYTEFRPNEHVDSFVGDISIAKRMVASTVLVGSINKLLIELDRSVKDIMGIEYDDSKV